MTTQTYSALISTDLVGNISIAMHLACGDTVLLKTSKISPVVHAIIKQVLHEAGLGNGVLM